MGKRPLSRGGVAEARDPLELHAQGIEAFRAGRLEMAASLIAQAIALHGQAPDFHYNLAIVQKARGRLEEAAASYERAIQLKPDYADAHNNLGNVWKALGERAKAAASFARALEAKPGNADTHYNLGNLCSEAGDGDEAARHYRRCLACDPEDSRGVRILLARLGADEAPERTSPAQLRKIYAVRARFWDREDSYFGHLLVAEALRVHAARDGLDIVDIGCGTGLVGAHVRHLAGRLDGVDLSSAMLERARGKSLYDGLYETDLVSFLADNGNSYDAILAAAALIHFGDLSALLQAAWDCLRQDGLFIFTLFSDDADDADFAVASSDRLAQSGCFRHSAGYVERLASEAGFSILALKKILHEHDQDGNPVAGLLAVLRKRRQGPDMP